MRSKRTGALVVLLAASACTGTVEMDDPEGDKLRIKFPAAFEVSARMTATDFRGKKTGFTQTFALRLEDGAPGRFVFSAGGEEQAGSVDLYHGLPWALVGRLRVEGPYTLESGAVVNATFTYENLYLRPGTESDLSGTVSGSVRFAYTDYIEDRQLAGTLVGVAKPVDGNGAR